MPLTVRHLDGPHEGRVQTFDDEVESILIGRDSGSCQIVLSSEARMAGREHCTLARIRGRYIIDMDADRRVMLDGWQLLDSGTPLPDSCEIQIGPDGPRLKLLATRHSGMASTADQQIDEDEVVRRASRPASEVDVAEVAQTAGGSRRIGLAAGIVAAIAAVAGVVFFVVTQSDVSELQVADTEHDGAIGNLEGRTDEIEDDLIVLGADLPEIMQAASGSVYLVVIQGADGGETGIGTAFAVAPNAVATNAHVANWLDQLTDGESMLLRSAAIQGRDPVDITVEKATVHPGYEAFAELWRDYVPVRINASSGVDAIRSAGSACDLALLHVRADATLGEPLILAEDRHQAALLPGHALASVGFPMEGMALDGTNLQRPTPQAHLGRVTALTTFFNTSEDETSSGPGQRNILLQHSIPGTGGASGSPILNGAGEVVGILSAVNFAIVAGQRVPMSVGVNFAQRATLLEELLDGTAQERLPLRMLDWGNGVKGLYLSAQLMRSEGGLDDLLRVWRGNVAVDAGSDKVLMVNELQREYFPLDSLEAGRRASGSTVEGFASEITFDVENGGWYLLAATSDGDVDVDIDEVSHNAGYIGHVTVVRTSDGTAGVAFQGTGSGSITGSFRSSGSEHVEGGVWGARASDNDIATVLMSQRGDWKDDLHRRWDIDVRDTGGSVASDQISGDDGSGGFSELVPLAIDQRGKYILAAVAPDEQAIGLRLWQVVEGERELLSEAPDIDWHPYLSFSTTVGASLEAEVFSASADVDFQLHIHRAVLRGDTDLDDVVALSDLINVIVDFGEVCNEGTSCASDVDESGTVQIRDLLTVLNDMGSDWPPSSSRFKAWAWAPVTMATVERMAPFVWAASWVQPEEVASALNAQPEGERVLFFFANITNDMADHEDDRCVTVVDGQEVHTEFRSPWIDNGSLKVKAAMQDYFSRLHAAGAIIDAVILDNEKTLNYGTFMDSGRENFQAIMDDPRFADIADDLGIDDLTDISWGSESSRVWDDYWVPQFDAAVQECVFDVAAEHYPDALMSNYGCYRIGADHQTMGVGGHIKRRSGNQVGTHVSLPFYPTLNSTAVNRSPDGTDVVGDDGYGGLLLMMHWLHGVQESSSVPVMPWVTNRAWSSGDSPFHNIFTDDPYWDEMILHFGLRGVDRFLYWVEQNVFIHDPGHNNPPEDQRRMADLLQILDEYCGPDGVSISLPVFRFDDHVVASGVQRGDTKVWRFTFDEGVTLAQVRLSDGRTVLIEPSDGTRGAWLSHDAGLNLVRESDGSVEIIW